MPIAARATPRSFVVLLLAAVALLGFFSGHRLRERPQSVREVSIPGGSLNYSTSSHWRPASAVAAPSSLAISQQFALAPSGGGSGAALIVGQLPNAADPLPAAFLAGMRQLPETQVVYLANAEAYRYSGLESAAGKTAFTVYAIPTGTPHDTGIVCYAPAAAAAELHECEAIAATLTRTLPEAGVVLAPDPHAAREVRVAIDRFDRVRASLRSQIAPGARVPQVNALALRLATGAAEAASSIARVPVPPTAKKAQATLVAALTRTGSAYSQLATALAAGSAPEYALARTAVDTAESRVDAALASFALLGYDAS